MYRNLIGLIGLVIYSSVFALPDDQYQPIEIHADSATRNEKQGITIYQGNVFMKQGSLEVRADNITVRNPDDASANLVATGKPAHFQQQPEPDKDVVHASATTILYLLDDGKIELTGNALLTQGDAKISSDRIVYLSNEQLFKAEKNTTLPDTQSQRVQVIIPSRKKPPATNDTAE
jgi:lipopolysaccharide export system protein LptA